MSDEINRPFSMFNAIVLIAIIVSLLGVINTLAMCVLERTREIGGCARSDPRGGRSARPCLTRA